jgi:hypothetical protein
MGDGNFVLTTTSKAQETNWRHIFQRVAANRGGAGVVIPANKYAPETVPALGQWIGRYPGKFDDPLRWRDHCALIRNLRGGGYWMPDEHMRVSIVDEAHALINPEHSDARTQSGWPNNLGPQGYHIIRSSTVSIFLLDGEQSFRERESTTIEDLRRWAEELGAEVAPIISLAGGQFRCAGSKEFVEWVDTLCRGDDEALCATLAKPWSEHESDASESEIGLVAERPTGSTQLMTKSRRGRLQFRLFDSPFQLEAALRQCLSEGASARLVAPFARKWLTKEVANPHTLPRDMLDFQIEISNGSETRVWSRPWNVVPGGDEYTHFIQGPFGSRIHEDPLAEVGCPYAVRGFDFDYVGLLWLGDLKWRSGRWQVFPREVHETGLTRCIQRARREQDAFGPCHQTLLKKVLQAYRILLTRAIKGVYLWCEDKQTREHLKGALGLKD